MNLATKIGLGVVGVGALGVGGYFFYKKVIKKSPKVTSPDLGKVASYLAPSSSSTTSSSWKAESFPLKEGMKGEKTKIVQSYLSKLGFDIGSAGADGKFGTKTKTALLKRRPNDKGEVTEKEYTNIKNREATMSFDGGMAFDGGEYSSQDDLL